MDDATSYTLDFHLKVWSRLQRALLT